MTIVGIAALAMVIAGLVGTYTYFRWKAEQVVTLDPDTYCPINGPVSTVAVLLDLTDPVARPTLDDIKNKFEKLMAEVPQNGLLSIFALTEHTSEIEQKVAVV